MAGKPGKSGGSRPGAGGPRRPKEVKRAKRFETDDPLEFLRQVMKDPSIDFRERQAAAMRLAQIEGKASAAPGKKAGRQKDAEAVAGTGRFAAIPAPKGPPTLKVVGGRRS